MLRFLYVQNSKNAYFCMYKIHFYLNLTYFCMYKIHFLIFVCTKFAVFDFCMYKIIEQEKMKFDRKMIFVCTKNALFDRFCPVWSNITPILSI